jgi:beta-glucanase (GH16 family)
MPIGDMPGWHQVFADDFTTDVPLGKFPGAVADKWSAYPDGWNDTTKNGTYYPSKVISIRNGVLNMYLHTENGIHMVSAPEPKIPGAVGSEGGLLYGRYVIRFRADPIPGYKTAWLLWPDSETWPRDGEIDFPEGDLDGTLSAFMHRQNGTSGDDQDAFDSSITYTAWHTATLEWLPSSVRFFLDGKLIGTSTSRIPDTPMHWVIQTETATDGSVPSNTAAGNVQIDWVSVYVPRAAPSIPPPTPVSHSTPTATAVSSPAPTAVPTPPQAASRRRREPQTGSNSSPAGTIESLTSKGRIPTTVVTLLSSGLAYARRLRKAKVHRLLSRRRRW